MSDTTPPPVTFPDRHQLTQNEKDLRAWLETQPNGGHWWMVIKSGFRKSYALGHDDGYEAGHTVGWAEGFENGNGEN